jgi:hypothetical protein
MALRLIVLKKPSRTSNGWRHRLKGMLWQVRPLEIEQSVMSGLKYYQEKYKTRATHVFIPPVWNGLSVVGIVIEKKATGSPLTVLIGEP